MKLSTTTIAATMLLGAALSASSAKADMNYGPVKNGNQCWSFSANSLHSEYGYWVACPAPASAPIPVVHHARHHAKQS